MDSSERARLLLLNIPWNINPLEVATAWVRNLGSGKFHLTVDGCPYGILIRFTKRAYQNETPTHEQMCGFCRKKWEKAIRDAA